MRVRHALKSLVLAGLIAAGLLAPAVIGAGQADRAQGGAALRLNPVTVQVLDVPGSQS